MASSEGCYNITTVVLNEANAWTGKHYSLKSSYFRFIKCANMHVQRHRILLASYLITELKVPGELILKTPLVMGNTRNVSCSYWGFGFGEV